MLINVKKYFEISSIHGLFYISKRFNLTEKYVKKIYSVLKIVKLISNFFRVFWVIALIFSAICSSVLIFQLVIKMQNLPIIVFLSDQLVFVSEVNFDDFFCTFHE